VKFFALLFLLNVCALSTALGHLNDLKADLIDRFGVPVLEQNNRAFGSQECVFQKGEWEVHAFLLDGRCQMIRYVKKGDGGESGATAVFKTERWKMLEGQPLGFGSPGGGPLASAW
jgi:hypothetical protein